MNDTRRVLEQATRWAPTSHADLEALYERRDAKRRRSRVLAASLALVITLGGTAFAIRAIGGPARTALSGGGQIGTPTQNLQLGEGEYYYQRFDGGWGVCESWWALDDSGRLDIAVKSSGGGSCWGSKKGICEPGTFYSDSGAVAQLSTDPQELLSQLEDRVQPDGASPEPYADWGGPIEWGLIRSLGELLQAPDVTPEQKAAMMVVAADLSTSIDTDAPDPEGRPAILLTLDSEHQTHQWWFDPESHQPLAMGGFIVQAAGVVRSTDTTDLSRSFVRQIQP